jgi:hypothetical protein
LALLAGVLASVGAVDVRAADLPPTRWPHLVILVVERRVPARTSEVGTRLRRLRETVVRVVTTGPEPMLAPGDQLVAFTDGIGQEEHRRLLRGLAGSGRVDAQAFLAHHLRLPPARPDAGGTVVRDPDGVEFLDEPYDGDVQRLACTIAARVTAPMTLASSGPSSCPTEGVEHSFDAARAVSRPELTYPIQVNRALGRLPPDAAPARVFWVLVRVGPRIYLDLDVYSRITQDYPGATATFLRYADDARTAYPLTPLYTVPLEPGHEEHGVVQVFEMSWRPSVEMGRRIQREEPGLLALYIGHRCVQPFTRDVHVAVSPFGEWDSCLDSLVPRATAGSNDAARLVGGRLHAAARGALEEVIRPADPRWWDGLRPDPDDRAALIPAPATAERLRSALERLRARGRPAAGALDVDMELLIAARAEGDLAQAAASYGWSPLPAPVRVVRRVSVTPRRATPYELGIAGLTFGLAGFLLYRVVRTFAPADVALAVRLRHGPDWALERDELVLTTRAVDAEGEARIELLAGTTGRVRRLGRAPCEVGIRWDFLASLQLPVHDPSRPPVDVDLRGTVVAAGGPAVIPTRCRLGSPSRARPTGVVATLRLARDRLDVAAIPRGDAFRCMVRLDAALTSRRRLLRCRPARAVVNIPLEIRVEEERPDPVVRLGVDGTHRLLGLDLPPGDAPAAFATLEVANPPRTAGVARAITVAAAIHRDAAAPTVGLWMVLADFDGTQCDEGVRLASGGRCRFRILLEPPAGFAGGPSGVPVRGLVRVEWRTDAGEHGTIERALAVEWIPVDASALGLDLGTSGSRIAMTVPDSPGHLAAVQFTMDRVHPDQGGEPFEFPAAVTIAAGGEVSRAGLQADGVPRDPVNRLVLSPKGALLAAGSERAAVAAARGDVEAYVRALARAAAPEVRRRAEHVKIIAAVPGSFGGDNAKWYTRVLGATFPGVAKVTTIREAEAVAYYHLLAPRSLYGPDFVPLPDDHEYRCLVVDQGAGTTDFAIVGIRTGGVRKGIEWVRTVASTQSAFAGDRYDERFLECVFGVGDASARLSRERLWRDEVRRLKQDELPRKIDAARQEGPDAVLTFDHDVFGHRRVSLADFDSVMQPFFEGAFDVPVARLADDVRGRGEGGYLDLLLLAGRGMLAPDCRTRAEQAVMAVFEPAPGAVRIVVERVPDRDLASAVAKGAVRFALDGQVVLNQSDVTLARDVALFAAGGAGSVPDVRIIATRGASTNGAETLLDFDFDVLNAWIVATEAAVHRPAVQAELFRWLQEGVEARRDAALLAYLRPGYVTRRLRVRVENDERAAISDGCAEVARS